MKPSCPHSQSIPTTHQLDILMPLEFIHCSGSLNRHRVSLDGNGPDHFLPQPLSDPKIKPKFLHGLSPVWVGPFPISPPYHFLLYTALSMLATTKSNSFSPALRFWSKLFALPERIFSFSYFLRITPSQIC